MQFLCSTSIGDFLHNRSAIPFTLELALPDAQRFIVPLQALSCKIPVRRTLVLLSCGPPLPMAAGSAASFCLPERSGRRFPAVSNEMNGELKLEDG
jgi:hypothetical protein